MYSDSYKKAERRVREIKAFYVHLLIFVATTLGSLLIGFILSYTLFLSFLIGFVGWAIGVAIHGINVFGTQLFLGRNWEQRKLAELMQTYKEKEDA